MKKGLNRIINFLYVLVNSFAKFGVRKKRRYSFYENRAEIISLNRLLNKSAVDLANITEVYQLVLTTYKVQTINLIRKIPQNESYYCINILEFYLDTAFDSDGYEDFVGDVISLFFIRTKSTINYLLAIKRDFSKSEYAEHIILLEPVKRFNPYIVTSARKICDELPSESFFDN